MFLLLPLLFACAESTKPTAINRFDQFVTNNALSAKQHITAFTMDSWSYLDRNHLMLWTTAHRPFLLKLRTNCHDLAFSEAVRFTNRSPTLSAGLDAVETVRAPQQRCFISEIYALTREQEKALQDLRQDRE